MFAICSSVSLRQLALLCLLVLISSTKIAQAQCTDVHVVFARGSTELPGLGICGKPLVSGITKNLAGKSVSSYAVDYLADAAQTSAGPGATDMTKHIVSYAEKCPDAVFVIGGYSQGGSVTDIAIGIRTSLGKGQTIPTALAPRIKAVVVFGNPLKLFGKTIATASDLYGSKAIEYCNSGDPVCAAGVNMAAHLTYPVDGSVTKAAQRAAQMVGTSGGKEGNSTEETTPSSEAEITKPSSKLSDRLPSFGFSSLQHDSN
jgi:cutinase